MNSTEPCPTCGGTGKRWRTLSGMDVCDECAVEYMCTLEGRKMMEARSKLQDASRPRASESPRLVRHNPSYVQRLTTGNLRASQRGGLDALGTKASPSKPQPPDDIRCKRKWKETLAELVTPGYNSLCLLCSHIFYGAAMSSCPRCGGLCQQISDHDLGLMGRHATHLIEAEAEK